VEESEVVIAVNKARNGIAQYLEIISSLPDVDVSRDRDFQRKYNAFYRVRQRPKQWYELYFSYLESSKTKVPSFDTVIDYLFSGLGRYEPSFSSKLVATLDPHQPIWDKFVLKNTGQRAPDYTARDRLEKAKTVYRSIQAWYEQYIGSEKGRTVIRVFNREIQDHQRLTDLKKIDFVLWQTRA
jgi:hypothetical protein